MVQYDLNSQNNQCKLIQQVMLIAILIQLSYVNLTKYVYHYRVGCINQ